MAVISTQLSDTVGPFNNSTATTKSFDITSFTGAAFTVLVTGAAGAGTMKLQGSQNPSDSGSWVDIPATLGGATVSQTITIGAYHYLNTGNIAYYPAVRVSITSTNTNNITATIKGMAKG